MIEVRPGRKEDIQYVLDIDVKCFDDPWSPDKWRKDELSVAVGTVHKTPVGVVVFEIINTRKQQCVRMDKIAVKPGFRNRGIAKALVQEVRNCCMYNGLLYIETIIPESMCVPDTPRDVTGFLSKVGFRGFGIKRDAFTDMGQPEDGYIFRLEIK